jgi:hypothetical protein
MQIELPRTQAQLRACFPGYSATLLREEIYTYAMRLVALGVNGNLLDEDERLDRETKARLAKVNEVFQQEWKGH